MRPRHLRLLLAPFLVLALLGASAPTVASPPGVFVCDPCEETFVAAAEQHDLDVTVVDSTAVVRVHENGSATWTVRTRLADEHTPFTDDPDLATAVAEDAVDWSRSGGGSHHLESVSVTDSGSNVTMRYRTSAFAAKSLDGTYYTDYFRVGTDNPTALGAERVTVVAPAGTNVGEAVPGSAVDGDRMTLTTFDPEGDGPFVTFVPEDSSGSASVLARLAATPGYASLVAHNGTWLVVVPSLVFALTMFGVCTVLAGRDLPDSVRRYGWPTVAVVGLVVLVSGISNANSRLLSVGVGLSLTGVGLSRPGVRSRATYRSLVVATVGVTALALASTVVAASLGVDYGLAPPDARTNLLFLAPMLALVPAGYALEQTTRRRAVVTATVGFATGLALSLSLTSEPDRFFALFPILFSVYGLLVATLGLPLFALGRSLADAA